MAQLYTILRLGSMGGLVFIGYSDIQRGDLQSAALALALALLAAR